MKIKLKTHKTKVKTKKVEHKPKYGETFDWSDVFYIIDLNDSEQPHRKNATVEKDGHWYNLRLRPNTIRPESNHYCVACGSNLDKILACLSRHISMYKDIYNYYESLANLSDGGVVGKITLEQLSDYWDDFGDSEYIYRYEEQINQAIQEGKQTTIIYGSNVKATYNEEKGILKFEGRQATWTQLLIAKIGTFKGHTKKQLYAILKDEIDTDCMNQIFKGLKDIGCYSIRDMKSLNEYRLTDVIATLVNGWYFDDGWYE